MFHLIFAILAVLTAWKWGDWKNWRLYYPTILFLILGDMIQNVITYNYPLWQYNSKLPHTLINLIIAFTVFPSLVTLFIPYHPQKGIFKKFVYMITLAISFTLFEWISVRLGYFSYYHNWNIGYSLIFNILMVFLVRIHYNEPRIAIPLAAALGFGIAIYFKIPLTSIK